MTSTQKRTYKLLATPIAAAISVAGLIVFRLINMPHVYCIFFVLFMSAIYQYAHISAAKNDPNNRASTAMAALYSIIMLTIMTFIACTKDVRTISIASVLTLAIAAIAGVSAFVSLAVRHVFSKEKPNVPTSSRGFDYIPEKERYIKDRKKRQRQHAADRVRALGIFGNDTYAIIYTALSFILTIIAVFNDLELF